MATAPTPGAVGQSKRRLRIRLGDALHELDLGRLGPADSLLVRKETGIPLGQFIRDEDRFDSDSLLVIWWLARRQAGETKLPFKQAASEFPSFEQLGEMPVEIEEITPDGSPAVIDTTGDEEFPDPEA